MDVSNKGIFTPMESTESLRISFPIDEGYVAHVRGLVADSALLAGFGQKFAHRSELVLEELLQNAVRLGTPGDIVDLECEIAGNELRLVLCGVPHGLAGEMESGKSCEIVRMLASNLESGCDENGDNMIKVIHAFEPEHR